MLIRYLFTLLLGTSLIQTCLSLELNGIGSYKQLQKEFYIGALYLDQVNSDPSAILANTASKRMTLKVTAKRWSPRRWELQWQNDIAINNSFDNDPELINQIMFFTAFLEDNLTTGDEILIDYIASAGTIISINGVVIIETQNAKLFNNLLNVWIGKLPPSGEFKTHILGSDKASQQALLNRYNQVNYGYSRSNVISSWIQARKDAQLAEQRKQEAEKQKALAAKQEKAEALEKAAQEQQKKTYIPPKTITKKKEPPKKKKITSVAVESTAKKSKKEIAAENQYYLDLYRWELIREVRNVVEYPEWAKRFGQSGQAKLTFNINRNAEISNISGDNSGISPLLVTELERAILSAAPFILPPDALAGNSWPITIDYTFDPKSDLQQPLKRPIKPKSLVSADNISRADYKATLSNYIDDVTGIIMGRIEYPVWAKQLNQKGKVAFEVEINRNGSISISEKTLSRHQILNQEVLDAIKASEPLPPIPEALNLNRTQITIEYDFK